MDNNLEMSHNLTDELRTYFSDNVGMGICKQWMDDFPIGSYCYYTTTIKNINIVNRENGWQCKNDTIRIPCIVIGHKIQKTYLVAIIYVPSFDSEMEVLHQDLGHLNINNKN